MRFEWLNKIAVYHFLYKYSQEKKNKRIRPRKEIGLQIIYGKLIAIGVSCNNVPFYLLYLFALYEALLPGEGTLSLTSSLYKRGRIMALDKRLTRNSGTHSERLSRDVTSTHRC